MRVPLSLLFALLSVAAVAVPGASAPPIAVTDSERELDALLSQEKTTPNDPALLQRIARLYSDRVEELSDASAQCASAAQALAYAERAVALRPNDAANLLSVAISHGKLALYAETSAKIAHSRQVRDYAERALVAAPEYAWAHHVLGRWHYEVAQLGFAKRTLVRAFYGGLPNASTEDAVRHLARAVELEPGELAHSIELGFALLAAEKPAEARVALQRGLALPSTARHHKPAKARAREALARLM